jgi:hypothetical protein
MDGSAKDIRFIEQGVSTRYYFTHMQRYSASQAGRNATRGIGVVKKALDGKGIFRGSLGTIVGCHDRISPRIYEVVPP